MTVLPNGSPASALPSHQPTCWTFSGTWVCPSTVARRPYRRLGIAGQDQQLRHEVHPLGPALFADPGGRNRTRLVLRCCRADRGGPGPRTGWIVDPAAAPQPASQPMRHHSTDRARQFGVARSGRVLLPSTDELESRDRPPTPAFTRTGWPDPSAGRRDHVHRDVHRLLGRITDGVHPVHRSALDRQLHRAEDNGLRSPRSARS